MNSICSRLEVWKRKGFSPNIIYDVGAFQGTWSRAVHRVFPNADFFLFEANEANRPALEKTHFPFFMELLGDNEREVSFYSTQVPCSGESVFLEQSSHFDLENVRVERKTMRTLVSLVKEKGLPLPNLVKLDVQGAELLILEGGHEIISHAEAVIVETKVLEYNRGAPLCLEVFTYMDSMGYRVLDLLELHYLAGGELNEVDYLFVKKSASWIPRPPFSV